MEAEERWKKKGEKWKKKRKEEGRYGRQR